MEAIKRAEMFCHSCCSAVRGCGSVCGGGFLRRIPPVHPIAILLSLTPANERAGQGKEGRKEVFYLTTHSTHLVTVIWRSTYGKGPSRKQEETRCRHMGYSFRLAARVLLYTPSHRQDSTYHGLCYTSRGALAGTRNRPR